MSIGLDLLISFDPGGKSTSIKNKHNTGIVAIHNIDYTQREPTFDIAFSALVSFDDRYKIFDLLQKYELYIAHIIIEDFLLRENKTNEQINSRFETVKVIERITVYAEQLALDHKITMQQSGLRLSAQAPTGVHLAALGHNKHLEAAYRHARYFIFMHRKRANPESENLL
jgi:hypothetical protein